MPTNNMWHNHSNHNADVHSTTSESKSVFFFPYEQFKYSLFLSKTDGESIEQPTDTSSWTHGIYLHCDDSTFSWLCHIVLIYSTRRLCYIYYVFQGHHTGIHEATFAARNCSMPIRTSCILCYTIIWNVACVCWPNCFPALPLKNCFIIFQLLFFSNEFLRYELAVFPPKGGTMALPHPLIL